MTERATANERLQRLLAIVPWVAAHEGPTIDEVCARFELTPERLVADLELVSMVGVHPFTPDELVDVVVEDGRVWAHYAMSFARPLRLTPEQGLALVAAGRTLLAVPGADPSGPLARGLDKLAEVLGLESDEALEIDLGDAPVGTLEVLEQAISEQRQVELDYYAYGRDEHTHRIVDPLRVYATQGQWYLVANCHRAGGERVFRVDRITAADLLDSTFDRPAGAPGLAVFEAGAADPRVTIELAPSARWVVEQYPVDDVEELGDGRLRATLAISARPWLERLLLRLGADAHVVWSSDDAIDDSMTAAAASRLLARYGAAHES